ncbi:hypothetical protein L6452_05042 [Arctium lappa]|uniref:Uncharacterized protein n=1 Tax=Arctium lappa TaxID=4217 RepID=A0ACB9EFB2_ARCLA|nr:hypothetical protein L6452_05042 [Arctium lappa]
MEPIVSSSVSTDSFLLWFLLSLNRCCDGDRLQKMVLRWGSTAENVFKHSREGGVPVEIMYEKGKMTMEKKPFRLDPISFHS